MSIWSSLKRYIVTLGGLIGGDIDASTDRMVSSPSGIKATFSKTRENWTKQYAEVREAVAQLMMVLEQKRQSADSLRKETEDLEVKMRGAVQQFKKTNDQKYQQAFSELYNRKQAVEQEQEKLSGEIGDLQDKVAQYKEKLNEMQKRIHELKKEEASAIADIVSSKQIISLNDRLNNLSTQLDDRNLQAVQDTRQSLKAQAKLSESVTETADVSEDLEKELMAAGMQNEAADVFAAMLKDSEQGESAPAEKDRQSKQREL